MGVSRCHCQHSPQEKGNRRALSPRVHGWLSFTFHFHFHPPSCHCDRKLIRLLPASSQRQCTQDLSFSGGLHLLVLPDPAAHAGLAILSLGSDSALPPGALLRTGISDRSARLSSILHRFFTPASPPDYGFRFLQLLAGELTCKPRFALLSIYLGRLSPPLPGGPRSLA